MRASAAGDRINIVKKILNVSLIRVAARSYTSYTTNDEFVEQIGVIFQTDGMPRVAGRLFGLLLLSAEPRSLDELAKKLRVSKASVSVNARLLEEKGIVERIGRQADRRDYYQIADDIIERMLEQRMAKIRRIQRSLADVRARSTFEHKDVGARLENIELAHNHLLAVTERTLEEWRARQAKRPSPPSSHRTR